MAQAILPQAAKGLVKKGSISLAKNSAPSGLVDMKPSKKPPKKQDEPKQYSTKKHHLPQEPQKSKELAVSSKLSYERNNDRTKKTSTTNSAVVSCKQKTHGPKQSTMRHHPVQTKISKAYEKNINSPQKLVSCKTNNNGTIKSSTKYPVATKRKISKEMESSVVVQLKKMKINKAGSSNNEPQVVKRIHIKRKAVAHMPSVDAKKKKKHSSSEKGASQVVNKIRINRKAVATVAVETNTSNMIDKADEETEYRKINVAKFAFPNVWGHGIDQVLQKKQRLIPDHYTKIVQRLCDMVYNETHKPSNLQELVDALLTKYPGITYIDDRGYHDVDYTKLFILKKIQKRMSVLRGKDGKKIKPGRPSNREINGIERVENATTDTEIASEGDIVSYLENCRELVRLFPGSPSQTRFLWRETFKLRRKEIEEGQFFRQDVNVNIYSVIETRCPLLRQHDFLMEEMKLIFSKNEFDEAKSKWTTAVPFILEIAKKRNCKGVKKIFASYDAAEIDSSKDTQCCVALELLPVLMPASRRGFEDRRFFFDYRQDSVAIDNVVREKMRNEKQKRMSPYIVKIGDTYSIVADGKVLLELIGDCEAALQVLMSTYFIFNIEYADKVRPTYLFLEYLLLNRREEASKNKICKEILAELFDATKRKKQVEEQVGSRNQRSEEEVKGSQEEEEESEDAEERNEEGEERTGVVDERSEDGEQRSEDEEQRSEDEYKGSEEEDQRSEDEEQGSGEEEDGSEDGEQRIEYEDKGSEDEEQQSGEEEEESEEEEQRSEYEEQRSAYEFKGSEDEVEGSEEEEEGSGEEEEGSGEEEEGSEEDPLHIYIPRGRMK